MILTGYFASTHFRICDCKSVDYSANDGSTYGVTDAPAHSTHPRPIGLTFSGRSRLRSSIVFVRSIVLRPRDRSSRAIFPTRTLSRRRHRLLRCEPVLFLCQKTVQGNRHWHEKGDPQRKRPPWRGRLRRLNGVQRPKSNGASKETDDKGEHRNVAPLAPLQLSPVGHSLLSELFQYICGLCPASECVEEP